MTLSALVRAAESIGCTVETGGGRYAEIVIETPPGKRFRDGTHSAVAQINEWCTRRQAIDGLAEDVARGLADCPDDCECKE